MTTSRRHRLPEHARFLLRHCLLGVSVGLASAGGLLWFDLAGIGSLVAGGGRHGWVAVALLCFGFVITFGSLAMGSAIFMLGASRAEDDDGMRWAAPANRSHAAVPVRRRRR